ncbi:MAG: hypothetical protein M3436_04865 [Pseudomonadota bacterium]|nr:hypothetical protein [Pseudomonadota bacterium]
MYTRKWEAKQCRNYNDYRVVGPISLTHGDRVRFHIIEFEFALTGFSLADKTTVVGRTFNYAG